MAKKSRRKTRVRKGSSPRWNRQEREQRQLHDALTQPVEMPKVNELERLNNLVLTLTSQRDSALGEINQIYNLESAQERLDKLRRGILEIAESLLATAKLLKERVK